MSKNVIIEKSSKERIESISIGDLKFSLHDEFEYADGGIIVALYDNKMIKENYDGEGWDDLDNAFFSMEDDKAVPFENVACKLDIRDSQGGYTYHFDVNGNELYEE